MRAIGLLLLTIGLFACGFNLIMDLPIGGWALDTCEGKPLWCMMPPQIRLANHTQGLLIWVVVALAGGLIRYSFADTDSEVIAGCTERFNTAIAAQDLPKARKMLNKIASHTRKNGSVDLALLEARYAQAVGSDAEAEAILRRAVETDASATEPRMALARMLLNQKRFDEADIHLRLLADANVAEAAYCLGIGAKRIGDTSAALVWMEKAHKLNPGHKETQEQVENLRRELSSAG